MKETLRIIMKGPLIHPSWLSSVTKVFAEHKFYITGPTLHSFTQLHGIEPNVTVIESWEDLTRDPEWVKKYDLFLGYIDSDQPILVKDFNIPKVWRCYSPMGDPLKANVLGGPIVFNSYTAKTGSRDCLAQHPDLYPILDNASVSYDYKDPKIFRGWNGSERKALIVCHRFKERGESAGYNLYEEILKTPLSPGVDRIPITVLPEPGKELPLSDLVKAYQNHTVYLELTQTARTISGTIMEAMMTGMPVVSMPKADFPNLVRPYIEGFLAGNAKDFTFYISLMCNNIRHAEMLGKNARLRAIELCGESQARLAYEEAFYKAFNPRAYFPKHWVVKS